MVVASSSSSWLSTMATAPPFLCPCKANRRSAFVANRRMSSWSSPSNCTRNQAGSRCRKKKMKKQLGLLGIRAQLHHLRYELCGAAAAQRADRQQPLNPLRVSCCRRSSLKTEYGSSSSGWATAWKHSWMISLLRAATVWSNLPTPLSPPWL